MPRYRARQVARRFRKWVWPAFSVLAGVAEVIRGLDYTSMSWPELLDRGLKALPFIAVGVIARSELFREPETGKKVDAEDKEKVE